MKCIYWILIVLLFLGCSTPKPIITSDINVTREITEEPRISEYKVAEPDSALIRALAQCDENNQLLITALDSVNGSRIQASFQATPTNDGIILDFQCKEDSLVAEIEVRDRTIRELREEKKTIEVPVPIPLSTKSFCSYAPGIASTLISPITSIPLLELFVGLLKRSWSPLRIYNSQDTS